MVSNIEFPFEVIEDHLQDRTAWELIRADPPDDLHARHASVNVQQDGEGSPQFSH